MMHERKTVNTEQAAAIARVSRRTIYNWLKAGKLQWKRTAGGSLRIYEDSLWRSAETTTGTEMLQS